MFDEKSCIIIVDVRWKIIIFLCQQHVEITGRQKEMRQKMYLNEVLCEIE